MCLKSCTLSDVKPQDISDCFSLIKPCRRDHCTEMSLKQSLQLKAKKFQLSNLIQVSTLSHKAWIQTRISTEGEMGT